MLLIPNSKGGAWVGGQQQMGQSSSRDYTVVCCDFPVGLFSPPQTLYFLITELAAEIKAKLQFERSLPLAARQLCVPVCDLPLGFPYSERISRCMRSTARTSPGQNPCGGSALSAPSSR